MEEGKILITATQQQLAILGSPVGKGELMVLNAYAGTGKTTTLEMYARAYPQLRFLYLCFNRDNAEEARKRFPGNCTCVTTHSLAWSKVGRTYQRKMGAVRPRHIMDSLGVSKPFLAVYLINTLNRFFHSTSASILWDHIDCGPDTPPKTKRWIVETAKLIWDQMRDMGSKIPMTHDGYLKLWAMSRPELHGYDVIFLDEAQDTNPVTFEVVQNQVSAGRCGLILVGDTHQSIYRWRHAVDAMENAAAQASKLLPLSESFRFGQGIASDASILLNQLKEDPVYLKGRFESGERPKNFAVIGRTNALILDAAMEKAEEGMPIHFSATDPRKNWDPFVPYGFQITLDVYHIWTEDLRLVRDSYMQKFRSFSEVEEHANGEGEGHGRDLELAKQVELIQTYGNDIPRLLQLIREMSVSPDWARLSFTTAHRSKGKEWDSVRILSDFIDLQSEEVVDGKIDKSVLTEEFNLIYVALTRARKSVLYSQELFSWFQTFSDPNYNYPHRLPPKPPKDLNNLSTDPNE